MSAPSQVKIGMWHAIRDIIVASINKGQFLVAILGGVLLVTAWRMPAEQLPELAKRTLELLVKGKLLGWALFVVVSAAWAILGQVGRNAHRKEVKRIGAEKSKAQSRVQGKDVKSSNKSA